MQSVSTMPLFTSNKRMSVQLNSPKEQVPVQNPSISSDPHHFSLLMSSRRSRDKNCSTLCTKIPSFLKTSTVRNQASRTLINHTQILGSQDRQSAKIQSPRKNNPGDTPRCALSARKHQPKIVIDVVLHDKVNQAA